MVCSPRRQAPDALAGKNVTKFPHQNVKLFYQKKIKFEYQRNEKLE